MGRHEKSHTGRPELGWNIGQILEGAGEWRGCLNPISSDYMGAKAQGYEREIEEEAEMTNRVI